MNIEEYNLKNKELEYAESNVMLEWMTNLAKTLFTALIMINGGAIISLLTFIGNSKFIKTFSCFWVCSVSCFCLGIFFVLCAMCNAFFAQKIFREGLDKDIKNNNETDITTRNTKGINFRNWSIFNTIASIVCFSAGAIMAIVALGKSF